MSSEGDVPNWLSLIVEIGVAIFAIVISWRFYKKGKEAQNQSNQTMDRVDTILEEQKLRSDFRKRKLNDDLKEILNNFKIHLQIIQSQKRHSSSNDDGSKYAFVEIEEGLKF